MIGKNVIEIGATEFAQGMSAGNDSLDGGFSPQSITINPQTVPGVLLSGSAATDRSGSGSLINGVPIASCGDSLFGSVGNDKFLVTDTGRFYSYSGTTITLRQTGAGAKTYSNANTDMVAFRGDTFTTSETDIARLIQSNLTTPDANWESWWTVTQSAVSGGTSLNTGYRHPMVVFENALWFADGNLLHKWDGTTATKSFLTLSVEQAITALAVDPSTGKMLISINEGYNASSTKPYISKVLLFNGYSNKPDRAVVVDGMVTAIYPLGGVVYMCYGNSFGYWTGTGIQWLRNFKNVTNSTDLLVYKHRITSIGNTLYMVDGTYILAYGEVIPGKKVFYYAFELSYLGVSTIYAICHLRGIASTTTQELGIFCKVSTTAYIYTVIPNATSSLTNGTFYSKRYKFQRPIQIRGIYTEYYTGVANAASAGTASILDVPGNTTINIAVMTNGTGNTAYDSYNKWNGVNKLRTLQLIFAFGATTGIKRFVIDYDYVE